MFFRRHSLLIFVAFTFSVRAETTEENASVSTTSAPDPEPTTRKNTIIIESPNETVTLFPIPLPFSSTTKIPASSTSQIFTSNPTETSTEISTSHPSETSTSNPTEVSTSTSSGTSTSNPSETSTSNPTEISTSNPSGTSTSNPSEISTNNPTEISTSNPSGTSTSNPSEISTNNPTEISTSNPSGTSTSNPSETSTNNPSELSTSNTSTTPTGTTTEIPNKNLVQTVEEVGTIDKINPLIVEISTGKIKGREVKTKDQNRTYYAFQGVPYGKPPIGDLRFREPVPAEKWNETLQTLNDGPKCVQFASLPGSEDCLNLNVFSPKLQKNNAENSLLPVMVWVYGGAFVSGQANIDTFGPDFFIEEDVVVVSFNYRVGVFGFLSTGDYTATGNWGLKDQILALKWIQENIEKFGGNPKNVTLFGQSAGAACVSILVQSQLARGLFNKAIMQSGTSLNPWAHARDPRRSAFEIGRLLDIRTNDSKILIEQLRKVDYRTLHTVSVSTDLRETILHNPLDGLVFAPTTEVNHPGAVLANKSHDILKNGDFNRIPIIVGFNSQESIPFVNVLDYLRPYVASYDLFSTRLVPGSLNLDSNLMKIIVARLIKLKYFGWTPLVFASDKLKQFVTDDQFVRPIYEYIRQSSKYAPTYFYIFSYEGPLGVDGKKRESSGVGHSEDNKYLWHKESNIENAPDKDIKTRKRLVRLWTNFAKNGNPTPIADPLLQKVTWPPANIRAMVYLNINSELGLETDISRYNIQFWDLIFKTYGRPPYDTY